MRCARCGKMITNRMIKINGTVLCPECAKEAGLGNMFPDPEAMANDMMKGFFDADFASTVIPLMGELDFAPSRIQTKCPKCGTSLKDFESTGLLGCIECYNTFNESIMREMLKNRSMPEENPGRIQRSFLMEYPKWVMALKQQKRQREQKKQKRR